MDPQPCWIHGMNGQVEILFILIQLWCSTQRRDKKPSPWCIIETWNRWHGQGTGRVRYSLVSVFLSPAQWTDNDVQDGSSADKYYAWESCEVTLDDLQIAVAQKDPIVPEKATNIATEKVSTLEEFLKKKLQTRRRMSSRCAKSRTPRLILLLRPQWNPHEDITNQLHPSRGCHLHIKCPHFIFSALPYTAGHVRERCIYYTMRHHFYCSQMAKHCVQNFTEMSLMRPEWISRDAQGEYSALQSCSVFWVRGHWQLRTAIEDLDRKWTCRYNTIPALKINTSDSNRQDKFNANSDNTLEQLAPDI